VAGPLVHRMRSHTTTIFAEMTALATATGAVNLGQGFPDTDGPPRMLDHAARAIGEGLNQYPPGRGLPVLREAVAAHQERTYGLAYDPETEVLVTVGATEGIAASLLALVEPGDEVVVFEPYYDSYAAAVALAGGHRRAVTLRPDAGGARFTFDPAELRAAVGPRTRAVLVNSPHNPTGTVFTAGELEAIAGVCREHDLLAITDEVYEHLTYDGVRHLPLAGLPGMRERTVTVSSAGKTFSVTGWKVGWVCAPAPLISAVTTVKQFVTFSAAGPFQLAVAHALGEEQPWVAELCASLQARRDRLTEGLVASGLRVNRPAGSYFVLADLRAWGIDDGVAFARELPRTAGVAAIPAAVFYDDEAAGRPFLRFAFCKREAVLDEAVRRLGAAVAATTGP
jgi:N-succinyldiaminopimelate aminotransferase